VPAQHLRLQRAPGGAAVALGERPMSRRAGSRDGHGRRGSLRLLPPAAAAAPAHGYRWEYGRSALPSHLDLPFARGFVALFCLRNSWICCWPGQNGRCPAG
jgi:hypothetical protein